MRISRGLVSFASIGLVAGSVAAGSVEVATADPTDPVTVDFDHTGTVQTFTVPDGITEIDVVLCGAQGGSRNNRTGGLGGRTTATVTVTPTATLDVNVGGAGGDITGGGGAGAAGGFNGGGDGGDGSSSGGAGGGGATDLRPADGDLGDRLVVAGGGGGATAAERGGAGGGTNGNPGEGSTGGGGGTQTTGGAGGPGPVNGVDGELGVGGTGAQVPVDAGGGGGGGGYWGGGGGGEDRGGGGGGGSGFADPGLTSDAVLETGHAECTGDGFVEVTYVPDVVAPELTVPEDIGVDATGPDGAMVEFEATATDDVDPDPVVACDPLSGSTFAIGTTTVSCTATDAAGNSTSGDFEVTVRNLAPTPVDDAYETEEDTPLVVAAPGVLANDADGNGDPLDASLSDAPSHGTLDLAADGSFTYTPDRDFFGSDSFVYRVSDGNGGTASASVEITVEAAPLIATELDVTPAVLEVSLLGLHLRLLGGEAVLTNAVGVPMAGETVTFTAGGATVCSAVTDHDGVARCSGGAAGGLAQILDLGYDGHYGGGPDHLPSSGHAGLIGLFNLHLL